MADGSAHDLFLVPETAWGVAETTPVFDVVRHNGCTLAVAKNSLQSDEIRGDRQIAGFKLGSRQVSGAIPFELSYGSFDDILEAVLCGTWAVDTPSVGIDQLKVGSTRRSFNALRYFSDMGAAEKAYQLFTGIEFSTMSLAIAADAKVTGEFAAIGKGMSLSTTEPTGATYNAVTTTDIIDSFTGTLNEGGASIAVVTELTINLDNGIEPRFVVGSNETIRPSIKRSNVTGQMTTFFESATLLEKFLNETDSSIQATLIDLAGNQYDIYLPKIKYTGAPPDVSGDGPITLSMPFQAVYDATAATNFYIERNPV